MIIQQDIFDTVLAAMRKQGKLSMDSRCSYRGDDGAKCPIGHLIPDSDYCKSFEGNGMFELQGKISEVGLYCQKNIHFDLTFLSMLQKCHDTYNPYGSEDFMAFYERKMQAVATLFDLDYRPSVATREEPI